MGTVEGSNFPFVCEMTGLLIKQHINDPVHIHVSKDYMLAKCWIKPMAIAYNSGFKKNDLKKIKEIVFSHQKVIEDAWHEFFKQD